MDPKGIIILVALLVIFGVVVPLVMKRFQTDDDFGTSASTDPADGTDTADRKPTPPARKRAPRRR